MEITPVQSASPPRRTTYPPFEAIPFGGWQLGKCIGAGAFGEVYECNFTRENYGGMCAVKIAKIKSRSQEEVELLKNEIDILKEIRHDRVVAYYGSAEKDNCHHLFMELMTGGSLSDRIKEKGVLSERESRKYAEQMLEGVSFLHSKEIVHRDIKGSNILLDEDENVKLSDFGLSKIIEKIGSRTNLLSDCGTPYWMAPEIIWGGGYGRKVDIWSVGCTVVEMLTGKSPHGDLRPFQAIFRIGNEPTVPRLPEDISKAMKDLITAALTWNPERRPWSNELLDKFFPGRCSDPFWAIPFGGWQLGKCIGAGAIGGVYECNVTSGGMCAVKIARKEPRSQEKVKLLKNEIDILKEIRHDRVVAYCGSVEVENHLHLFMELMKGGSLSDRIKQKGVLSERESRKYAEQMLEGVSFLHSKNIVHRNIKGSNVLLDEYEDVKLTGFGLSKIIQKIESDTNLFSYCGISYWMAPEIFLGEGYGRKVDIWSVGCTVVEMLTGRPPLGDLEPTAAVFRIGSRPTEPNLPEHTSKAMKDLITAALTWNPKERPWSNDLLDKYF